MGVDGIGQTFEIQRAMLVIVDGSGRAQGWEIRDGDASWTFLDVAEDDGSSMATVIIAGKFKRRSKAIPLGVKELLE